jgi:hypothetical protein
MCAFAGENPLSVWHVADDGKPLSDGQIRKYVSRAYKLIEESGRSQR